MTIDESVMKTLAPAGANVTGATVTGVSAINSGVNQNLTPSGTPNTANPTSQSSSGVSGAVIGGAVGGGCAAVAILAFILYRVHVHRARKSMADLEASPAAKLSDSSSVSSMSSLGTPDTVMQSFAVSLYTVETK